MTKNQLFKYLKDANFNIQSANAALFLADFVFSFYADSHKIHKANFSPVCSYFSYTKLNSFFQIINNDSIVEVNEKVYNDFKKDKKSLDDKIREHQKLTKKLDVIWIEYQKVKKKNLNKTVLSKYYKKFENISRLWWYYGAIGEDKGAIIERKIIPSFAKRNNISLGKAQDLISVLSHPDEQAVFNLERKEFLQICILILQKKLKRKIENNQIDEVLKNNRALNNKINLYLKHYFWIKTDFYEIKEITREIFLQDVVMELNKKSEKEIKKELFFIDKNFKKIKDKKRKIIKKNKLTNQDKKEIYFSKKTIYWVDQRKLGMMKNIYYIFTLLDDIANLYNIEYRDIILYSTEDLKVLLSTGKKLGKKILKNRNDSAFMLCERGRPAKFFYGDTGAKMFEIATHVNQKELKGTVASKGKNKKVEGRVKIVLNPSKTDFKDGDILVTSMTRVEFVPLMRKAKAIVTNEGGLACHAAIVSRELGIPAIIGTKNATQVLKDGDIVEFNLKSGVILKK